MSDRREVYEGKYLRAIITSYDEIDKTGASENEIRNRLYWHLRTKKPITKELVDSGLLQITFEHWERVSEDENSRVDLTFFISGYFRFEVECKRLFKQWSLNKPYLNKGILRFIELKYSLQNDHGAMLGFVVSGDPNTIFAQLPPEVEVYHPCTPSVAPVIPINGDWDHSFISYHLRLSGEDIQIYHLLLPFLHKL